MEPTTNTVPNTPMRLSSKMTLLSFIIAPAFGLIIGAVIAVKTFYAWWGVLLGMAVAGYAIFFAIHIADATFETEVMHVKKPLGPKRQVRSTDIQRIRKFSSRRHNYFFFTCADHSFMLISPLWGPGRQALEDMYNLKKKV